MKLNRDQIQTKKEVLEIANKIEEYMMECLDFSNSFVSCGIKEVNDIQYTYGKFMSSFPFELRHSDLLAYIFVKALFECFLDEIRAFILISVVENKLNPVVSELFTEFCDSHSSLQKNPSTKNDIIIYIFNKETLEKGIAYTKLKIKNYKWENL